jgi:Uma2 family endonuclease
MGEPAPTTSPLVRRYTLEEFFELEPPADGGYYELIGGVLYMVPPPDWPHGRTTTHLIEILMRYQLSHPGSCRVVVPRAGVQRTPDTWLEPDLMLITQHRFDGVVKQLDGADLVVEISGPGSATYDRTTKADTYAALGVRELWLVDLADRSVEQRVLREPGRLETAGVFRGTEIIESTVFPGLRATAGSIFDG